ncbi:FAD/NAD(P)-binding protein [Amycolatopsis sp. lyj-108]|uniref:FAD/NAD(P)-binding protein n=1 Tax=Amycolatopsis sp. lyj-108 TaxID=2789286 RepID=UPI00397E2DA2
MTEPARVAVIGVGASGALAATHLLGAAVEHRRRLRLVLVDRGGEFGPGVAYRTTDPEHLLNTPAGKMSALDDDPGHFVRWSRARGWEAGDGTFLPRGDYGRYLTETLVAEERRAAGVATVERVTATAVGLATDEGGVTVELDGPGPIRADTVVLAPGAGHGDPLAGLLPGGADRYVADPWRGAGPEAATDGSPVLVLGTGLSMMDIAVSVTRAHPETVVHAVSRHGLLPRPHRSGRASEAVSVPEPPEQLDSLRDLLGYARRCLAREPEHWREFVDRMRPHTARLWRQLDLGERRRFLDRVNRFWDVHRHRAAPATHHRIRELLRSGRLRLHRGRVERVRPTTTGFDVGLATPSGSRKLPVGWLVNATGFRPEVRDDPDPLLRRLFTEGTAKPDPIGLGMATGRDGRVLGRHGDGRRIYTLGALRRGEEFESTAVPEIRSQAAAIAAATVGAREEEVTRR